MTTFAVYLTTLSVLFFKFDLVLEAYIIAKYTKTIADTLLCIYYIHKSLPDKSLVWPEVKEV